MERLVLANYDKIRLILKEYFNFLSNYSISNKKSLDYVLNIFEASDLTNNYLNTIFFNSTLESNGIYDYYNKKIELNPYYLEGSFKLGYISKEEMILDYFILLMHEIIHVYQKMYIENFNTDKSRVLKLSNELKMNLQNKINFQRLLPEEVNANLISSFLIYQLSSQELNICCKHISEKIFIYFLSLGLFDEENNINSQLKYLFKVLLNKEYFEYFPNLNEIDKVIYGLTKQSQTMEFIKTSYQTQKLCFDINFERRLKNERRNF